MISIQVLENINIREDTFLQLQTQVKKTENFSIKRVPSMSNQDICKRKNRCLNPNPHPLENCHVATVSGAVRFDATSGCGRCQLFKKNRMTGEITKCEYGFYTRQNCRNHMSRKHNIVGSTSQKMRKFQDALEGDKKYIWNCTEADCHTIKMSKNTTNNDASSSCNYKTDCSSDYSDTNSRKRKKRNKKDIKDKSKTFKDKKSKSKNDSKKNSNKNKNKNKKHKTSLSTSTSTVCCFIFYNHLTNMIDSANFYLCLT